jgi:hypothetical protein
MAIPCVESGNERALYFGELSCAFDFAESLLPGPKSSPKNELSLIASVSTFDEKRALF